MKIRSFQVYGFPFRKKHLMIVAFALGSISLTLVSHVQATAIQACDAECKFISCGDKVIYNNKGYVDGCKEKLFGDDCTANCYTCTGSTTDYHCVRKIGKFCQSDTGFPSTSCGTKTYYPCEGDHYPNCTCDTSGSGTPSSISCSRSTCVTEPQ